jgi:uncharacterized OB-fold protein
MEIARYWRLNNQRYSLRGTICTKCGKPSLSQRPVCDTCSESAADGNHKYVSRHETMAATEPAAK